MSAPRTFTLREIAARLGGEALGECPRPLAGVGTLESAGPDQIAFLANPKYRARLAATRAGAVILGPRERDATAIPRIVTDNPYAYYARAVSLFHPPPAVVPGVDPSASVHPTAMVAASARVEPRAVIGAGARVGERCAIGAGSVIGEGSVLGEDTRLHANVTIYAGCTIGARCVLHSGAVIGADGFGMAPEAGRWVKIAQVGGVRIGDDVEVGANTTIDRGAIEDTVVEEGVKLDNQIQIGHNCVVGAHTVIAGRAALAGSVRIGRHCLIGGGCGITGHLELCDGVTVSAMTLITKSIRQPGTYTSVPPFLPHAQWQRQAARIRREARLAAAASQGEVDRDRDDD